MTLPNFNAEEARKITAEAKIASNIEAEKIADKCINVIVDNISKEASLGRSFFYCSLYTVCGEVLRTFGHKSLVSSIVKRKLRKLNFSISKSFSDNNSFHIKW